MTVQVVKTKAESGLAEAFETVAARLPGGEAVRAVRRQAMGRFVAKGLPHRRIEEWKFTDLRTLLKELPAADAKASDGALALPAELAAIDACRLVFLDGKLVPDERAATETGLTVEGLAAALERNPALLALELPETVDAGADSLIALNTAFVTDGALIKVADGATLARPLHLVFVTSGRSVVRNALALGKGSRATVIETHICVGEGPGLESAVTALKLGDGARLDHVTVTESHGRSVALSHTIASLGADVAYHPFQLTIGPGLGRQQLTVTFAGERSTFDFGAVTLAGETGHADTTLVVDHRVPHCTSRELFKAVLADEAKGIFQGKVIVRPGAQKTDGKQMAQALMLSPVAEFDSKPELEIYADDVICGHGSTAAQLDEDLLFYCRSRGIPLAQARGLLITSFIGEALEKIGNETVREAVAALASRWLARIETD